MVVQCFGNHIIERMGTRVFLVVYGLSLLHMFWTIIGRNADAHATTGKNVMHESESNPSLIIFPQRIGV